MVGSKGNIMTRLSITLCTLALSISIAPAAHAYATEPGAGDYTPAVLQTPSNQQVATDTCAIKVTPLLAELIGLDPAWRESPSPTAQVSLACADD